MLASNWNLVRLLRGLTLSGFVKEVGDQVYEANDVTRHLTIRPVRAGMIHLYIQNHISLKLVLTICVATMLGSRASTPCLNIFE